MLGEAVIDLILDRDGRFVPHLGGSPYNVAIGLARQDVDVDYVSPFSDDKFGNTLKKNLIQEGAKSSFPRPSSKPTSIAMITMDEAGIPNYRLYRQGVADRDYTVEDILSCLPGQLQLFHTGSLAITPSQLPKIETLFERLKSRGVLISMDINIRLKGSPDTDAYRRGVEALIPQVDILKVSDEDLSDLRPETDPSKAAEGIAKNMSGLLLLTRGAQGVDLLSRGKAIHVDSHSVGQLVDTVGAGDTFHSAFLAELFRRSEVSTPISDIPEAVLGETLRYASLAAAINITRAGCSPPTQHEVQEILKLQAAIK